MCVCVCVCVFVLCVCVCMQVRYNLKNYFRNMVAYIGLHDQRYLNVDLI